MSTNETLGSFLKEYTAEVTAYTEARIQLTRITVIEKTAEIAASGSITVTLAALGLIMLLFFSVALACWIGTLLNSFSAGFALTGLLYLIIFVIIYLRRDKIRLSVADNLTGALLKDDSEEV